MKINKIKFLSCCLIFIIFSCAHKSGHRNMLEEGEDNQMQETQKSLDASAPQQDTLHSVKQSMNVPHENQAVMKSNEIFKKYDPAVFMIFTSNGVEGFQGSGFFISDDGLAVSNYHVFKNTKKGLEQIKLTGSNDCYKVDKVIYASSDQDFILFYVKGVNHTPYIPLAQNRPQVGDNVYAIGSPRGLENTFSEGIISQWRTPTIMQTSTQIDHGSSGGALINSHGEVVGITSGTFYDGSQANLNYAIYINVIKPYLPNSNTE